MAYVGELGSYQFLPLNRFPVKPGNEPVTGPAEGETAWRLAFFYYSSDAQGLTYEDYFARFLDEVDTKRVKELVLGAWGAPGEHSSATLVHLLTEAADRFPALRLIALGDVSSEEAEISWIMHEDVTPLLEAFPLLETLEIRGANGLELRPVRHDSLQMLRIESGGLPGSVVRAIGDYDLPALWDLELWLGDDMYGGDATADDLAGILSGERLPRLHSLALENSVIQDDIAVAIASAPVVARLKSLSLARGTLTDTGAEALLSGQPLTHLDELDLHHHFMSEEMATRVEAALPGIATGLDEREEPEDHGDDEVYFYVEVGE